MTKRELEKKLDTLTVLVISLQKENEELKAELNKYKNSNTPPSANKHLKSDTRGKSKKSKKKRGAQKGHIGKTRNQIPDRKEVIDADTCPNCGGKEVEDKKVYKKVIEEIPEPVEPEVVEYEIHAKECRQCGYSFIPGSAPIPAQGKFGFNIMALIVFLKYLLRGVLRKITGFLEAAYGLKLVPASVGAILNRASRAADCEYEELKKRIKSAARVYVDETSFSVLGLNWWVWVFRTSADLLIVIRPSRGKDVPLEILGPDFQGIVICDCWKAYNFLKIIQRCWSHLLRKAEKAMKEANTKAAQNFYKKLKALFKEIKRFNRKNQNEKRRQIKYQEMTKKLKSLIDYYRKYTELKVAIGYIENNFESWFTCIKFENVEPTNNWAEQAIRETVIVRKIIGAFRSVEGPGHYSVLASLIATWNIRGYNIFSKLKEIFAKYYQFC